MANIELDADPEISVYDIIDFFWNWKKLILLCTVSGILLALTLKYIWSDIIIEDTVVRVYVGGTPVDTRAEIEEQLQAFLKNSGVEASYDARRGVLKGSRTLSAEEVERQVPQVGSLSTVVLEFEKLMDEKVSSILDFPRTELQGLLETAGLQGFLETARERQERQKLMSYLDDRKKGLVDLVSVSVQQNRKKSPAVFLLAGSGFVAGTGIALFVTILGGWRTHRASLVASSLPRGAMSQRRLDAELIPEKS